MKNSIEFMISILVMFLVLKPMVAQDIEDGCNIETTRREFLETKNLSDAEGLEMINSMFDNASMFKSTAVLLEDMHNYFVEAGCFGKMRTWELEGYTISAELTDIWNATLVEGNFVSGLDITVDGSIVGVAVITDMLNISTFEDLMEIEQFIITGDDYFPVIYGLLTCSNGVQLQMDNVTDITDAILQNGTICKDNGANWESFQIIKEINPNYETSTYSNFEDGEAYLTVIISGNEADFNDKNSYFYLIGDMLQVSTK